VQEERRARFMQAQARISAARLKRRVGQVVTVLVDECRADGTAVARSAAEAPEIDGVIEIENAGRLKPGDWAKVRVTQAGEHDLRAQLAETR
jgi:ribosomal protein S12 methylthiotransferase